MTSTAEGASAPKEPQEQKGGKESRRALFGKVALAAFAVPFAVRMAPLTIQGGWNYAFGQAFQMLFVLQWWRGGDFRARSLWAAATALLVSIALICLTAHPFAPETTTADLLLAGTCIAAFPMLVIQVARKLSVEEILAPWLLFVRVALVDMLFIACIRATGHWWPSTYDPAVFWMDSWVGQPSFVLARVFAAPSVVRQIVSFVYFCFCPFLVFAVVAQHKSGRTSQTRNTLVGTAVIGVLGFAIYNMLPVVGPMFAFRGFPLELPSARASTLVLSERYREIPRNCVPSLHTAWVLFAFLRTRGCPRWVRVVAFLWLVLTELSTLVLGLHYLTDLVIAVPFVTLVQALCATKLPARAPARIQAAAVGAGLVAAWVGWLRFGPLESVPPSLGCVPFAATVAVALWLERRLDRRNAGPLLPRAG
jgi:hypothetical protein